MATLPALRRDLEMMPSPVPEQPGLLIRDPFRYTDTVAIVPPPLVPILALFDGAHSDLDLRAALVRLTGEIEVSDLARHLTESLSGGGFLADDAFFECRAARHDEFAQAPTRKATHAGGPYPAEAGALRSMLTGYLEGSAAPAHGDAYAVAAPHVTPSGGWRCYGEAYRALPEARGDATFVILGTSHYGEAERFGLTRKPFETPLGTTEVDLAGVEHLASASPEAVVLEDYCHAVEHSIEIQVVFLQHLFGPGVRVLPVLCGPFAHSLMQGLPEDSPALRCFFDGLGALARDRGPALRFVLGVDMSHVGRRYGDRFAVQADTGPMQEVAEKDRARLARLLAGDAHGFWDLVRDGGGDPNLRWCGSSPLYTFLRAVPAARGTLLHYEQWNIDPESVVSFAALAFRLGE